MPSLPEEQPGLANGVFCFFFQFLWSRGEDDFAELCSWKVHPVETGTFLSFYYYGQPWRRTPSPE